MAAHGGGTDTAGEPTLTAVELMKIADAVATAVGNSRCATMTTMAAKIPTPRR